MYCAGIVKAQKRTFSQSDPYLGEIVLFQETLLHEDGHFVKGKYCKLVKILRYFLVSGTTYGGNELQQHSTARSKRSTGNHCRNRPWAFN